MQAGGLDVNALGVGVTLLFSLKTSYHRCQASECVSRLLFLSCKWSGAWVPHGQGNPGLCSLGEQEARPSRWPQTFAGLFLSPLVLL